MLFSKNGGSEQSELLFNFIIILIANGGIKDALLLCCIFVIPYLLVSC